MRTIFVPESNYNLDWLFIYLFIYMCVRMKVVLYLIFFRCCIDSKIVCCYWIQQLGSLALKFTITMRICELNDDDEQWNGCAFILLLHSWRVSFRFLGLNLFFLRHAQFYCDENRKSTWLFGTTKKSNSQSKITNKIHQVWLVNHSHFISTQNSSSEKIIFFFIPLFLALSWSCSFHFIITCCAWMILCSIFIGLMYMMAHFDGIWNLMNEIHRLHRSVLHIYADTTVSVCICIPRPVCWFQ